MLGNNFVLMSPNQIRYGELSIGLDAFTYQPAHNLELKPKLFLSGIYIYPVLYFLKVHLHPYINHNNHYL